MDKETLNWINDQDLDLFVESYSNSARTVQVRGFSDAEKITADHTTNSNRSLATDVVNISRFPIGLTVRTAETSVSRGACYVKISVRANGVVVALLFSGYVTDAGAPAYPDGKIESSIEGPGLIRNITGSNPAAGSEISESVPSKARWRVKLFRTTLVTDATVTTRSVRLRFNISSLTAWNENAQSTQAASLTQNYNSAEGGARSAVAIQNVGGILPQDNILLAGMTIETATFGLQAGDDFDAPQYVVEEWIEP